MPAPLQVPARFTELVGRFSEVRRAFEIVNALQNLRVVIRLPDGTFAEGVVRITGRDAVVDLTGLPVSPAAPASLPDLVTEERAQQSAVRAPAGDGAKGLSR